MRYLLGGIYTLFLFGILSFSYSKIAYADGYQSFGVAAKTCQEFIMDDSNESLRLLYDATANAALTEANRAVYLLVKDEQIEDQKKGAKNLKPINVNVGESSTSEFRHQWLRQYCLENPKAYYSDAVGELWMFMFNKKM